MTTGENDGNNNPAGGQNPPANDGQNPPAKDGQNPPIGGADGGNGVYKPDGLAAHLVGQTNDETIDRLIKENKGFRDSQATAPKPPEKADGYKFEWSDRVKGYGAIAENDEVLTKFREIALEHGYTQKQMDAIPQIFDFMAEKGLIDKPFDTAGLLKSLAPEGFRGSPEEVEAKGGERLRTAENWIRQLTSAQGFSDGMKTEMRLLTTTKDGVAVIEKLINGGTNLSVSPGGGAQPAAVSKSDLDARVSDPRNDFLDSKYDPAYAEETRKLFQKVYPNGD